MLHSSLTLDPYQALEVSPDASSRAIKQAYRRIALESHPDHNSGDGEASERFRRASRAYTLLRDPERRATYDRTGRWDDSQWEPADLDVQLTEAIDIFAREFGSALNLPAEDGGGRAPTHAGSAAIPVDISFEEVERGGRRRMPASCARCAGSGARDGSAQVRCTSCGGSGRLRHVESSLLGPSIRTESCDSCRGSGRRPLLACPGCDGSGRAPGDAMVDVMIPRGIRDGDPLPSISANGTRFVARLLDDQRWARDGADLYATSRIPYGLAVLGGAVDLDLPGRTHRVEVDAGTASGHRLRIASKGLPLRDGSGRGDLIVTLHVDVPKKIGGLERWILAPRRGRAAAEPSTGLAARLIELQAKAWTAARGEWGQWRRRHFRASLVRVERAAASLRAAAVLVSRSEERLGPLLDRGFPLIAPEAAKARQRMAAKTSQPRPAATATFLVDIVLVAVVMASVWIGARYSAPALQAAGDTAWWTTIRAIHPGGFALVPLLAGLGAGAIAAMTPRQWILYLLAVPLGLTLAATWITMGSVWYALGVHLIPGVQSIGFSLFGATLAVTLSIASVALFLLGSTLVGSTRSAIAERSDRNDHRTLRRYDRTTARLADHLEATERAFRQLLAQADDARHPLTSLLDGAADLLTTDSRRRSRPGSLRATLALIGFIVVTGAWIGATAMAVMAAFHLVPEAPGWVRLTNAAAVAGLCALGSVLPPAFLERHRPRSAITAIATVIAVVALGGILGGAGAAGATAGWLVTAGAIAALALSFRLNESAHATMIAGVILTSGAMAILLWPFAIGLGALRSRGSATA
jgi:molecular chaperone DnaJ